MAATSAERSPAASRRAACRGAVPLILVVLTLICPALQAQTTTATSELRWKPAGTSAARATAQHSLSLAQPTQRQAAAAQTIDRAPSGETPAAVLRWRTSGVVRAKITSSGPDAPVEVITVSSGTGQTAERGAVRQASATTVAIPYTVPDPTDNPWKTTPRGPQLEPPRELPEFARGQATDIALVARQEPDLQRIPDPPNVELTPDDGSEWEEDPAPEPQSVPAPETERPLESTPQLLPAPADTSAAAAPCDRIYNERDCCKDEQKCGEARQHWQRDALAKISLDITPKLHPDVDDPWKGQSERNADLSQTPVRSWRDRQGRVLATGRLANIAHGRLLVLDASNAVIKVPYDELCDDDLCFVTAWWRIPTECTFGDEIFAGRNWQPSTLTWKATGVCHKPLYFEDPQLERYGHTTGHFTQPVLSGAHFFANLVALPYNAGIYPPWECQYPLGYYRPGSCAPWLVPPVPLSVRGALSAAGVWVGGIAIIP